MCVLQSGAGSQDEVESSAEAEIKEIMDRKEVFERKKAEAEAVREKRAKERDSTEVMWGMGESTVIRE